MKREKARLSGLCLPAWLAEPGERQERQTRACCFARTRGLAFAGLQEAAGQGLDHLQTPVFICYFVLLFYKYTVRGIRATCGLKISSGLRVSAGNKELANKSFKWFCIPSSEEPGACTNADNDTSVYSFWTCLFFSKDYESLEDNFSTQDSIGHIPIAP